MERIALHGRAPAQLQWANPDAGVMLRRRVEQNIQSFAQIRVNWRMDPMLALRLRKL
jgi:hypothetical protein